MTGVLTVTRISEASPPVSGTIDIAFNGTEEKGLNVSLTDAEFNKELESIEAIGALKIYKLGNCANFDLVTRFLTLPGNLPQMMVNYGEIKGKQASCRVSTDIDGGLNYDPLMGDMVSAVHELPQVRLYINDVQSKCSGNCSFQWIQAMTPEITGVNPLSGSQAKETTLIISGVGFSTNITKVNVTIGGAECKVLTAEERKITCDVGNGPLGLHPILVNIDGIGLAKGKINFTYISEITSIFPISGSIGGGLNLLILGHGFGKSITVSINDKTCKVKSVISGRIICIIPTSNISGIFDVHVTHSSGIKVTPSYKFEYELSKTAFVSSITPAVLNATGGNLTIIGSYFTTERGYVVVGSEFGTILYWSDTRIDLTVGEIDRGWNEIKIGAPYGLAVNGTSLQLPKIYVDLKVTHLYPLQGSVFGGTILTVRGSGFGNNVSNINIIVSKNRCNPFHITNFEVKCQLESTGITHFVTNKGVHPAFGVYYAFDKPYISINAGDIVQWSWETPAFVNNVTHSIIEIESPSSVKRMNEGFSSGVPTKNGIFRHQFLKKGTYYVWSGFVDIWGIKNYIGTIEVKEKRSTSGSLNVYVGKAEAEYVVRGTIDKKDDSVSEHIVTPKAGCYEETPSLTDLNTFFYTYSLCSTPIVYSINVNNGTIDTDIKINGEGFSAKQYQNEVKFGNYKCNVKWANDSSLTCNIDRNSRPVIAVQHQLHLKINNRGFSGIDISNVEKCSFAIHPSINTVNPIHGSLAGGARLTINGHGFDGLSYITIGRYDCMIMKHSYNQIICDVPSSDTEGKKRISVFVYIGDVPIQAKCESKYEECTYTYNSSLTPIMYDVTPKEYLPSNPFIISGSLFGYDTDDIDVTIGSVEAQVIETNGTYVIAKVDNVPAGDNSIIIKVSDFGKASGKLNVYGPLIVSDLFPLSGSLFGNTTLTIIGNGFISKNTTISLDDSNCKILSTNTSHITCLSKPHRTGSVEVSLSSNGFTAYYSSFKYTIESTPTVTSVSPTSGFPGDILTIKGSNFKGQYTNLSLNKVECRIISVHFDEIKCVSGNHSTGKVNISVMVAGLGVSNTDIQFEYQLSLLEITPTQGGIAGGQLITLKGTGMDNTLTATICGKICLLHFSSSVIYVCRTPVNNRLYNFRNSLLEYDL